ncbi:NAD-binding protein [Pholiota conissans]|uniref:NAD-binding protein n=1 Tax=Pholiota conissans TaxID=109636 RepID=A0A9P5Z7X5_9AGAR|nr:NAD-binding protein [Pholiota conissans]
MASAALGRVAIVTGASKGIGKAIALRLASDGYDVAVNDLPSTEGKLKEVGALISKEGRRAFVCPGDVSVEADVKKMVSSTAEGLGSVDVMVANAGICFVKSFSKTTVEDWDKIFGINARGVFLCYKYASEQMLKQGRGGKMIGATSIAGKKGYPGLSAYCGTKFAVRGLTQAVAQELAPHGITVNAYAPGLIETDMLAGMKKLPDPKERLSDVLDVNKPICALGYNGAPEDIAGLVSYLASPSTRYVTGQSFIVDGGSVYD